jgi:ethanolamine utilization protein EutP (predicted NTPase)
MTKSNVLPFRRLNGAAVTFEAQTRPEAGNHRALRSAILACLRDARVITAVDKAIKDRRG